MLVSLGGNFELEGSKSATGGKLVFVCVRISEALEVESFLGEGGDRLLDLARGLSLDLEYLLLGGGGGERL